MKYTIEGFSQAELIRLGLDHSDAILLRWFSDFNQTGRMDEFQGPDGKTYFWVKYSKVTEELPILGLNSPDAVAKRLRRLVASGVLLHYHHAVKGSFSTFRAGPAFASLVTSDPSEPKVGPLRTESRTPSEPKVGAKNSSTIDPFIKDKYTQDSQPLILATLLMTEHRKTDDKFLIGKERDTLQRWAADIDKLIRLDKRTHDEIRRVILWCQSPGCFWVSNILSGAKLREKFPQLIGQVAKVKPTESDDSWRFHDPLAEELKRVAR